MVGLLFFLTVASGVVQPQSERSVTHVADGVYFIRHRATPFEGGNTTVVIGSRDVLVIDSAFLPSAAEYDIEQIRKLTPKPVRYLLNTHWHGDHNGGNALYMMTFPGIAIIAQRETKRDMDLIVSSFLSRRTALEDATRQRISTGQDLTGRPLTEQQLAQEKANLKIFEANDREFSGWTYQGPTVVFKDSLDIDLGDCEVQIRFFGKGNTSGDAVAYLPKSKVLVTGDLLVYPFPFMDDGYPSEWAKTLDRLAQLDVQIIIPGHGNFFRDKTYLLLVRDFLQATVQKLNARLHEIGPAEFVTFEQVKDAIDLAEFRDRFVGNNARLQSGFDEAVELLKKLAYAEARLR